MPKRLWVTIAAVLVVAVVVSGVLLLPGLFNEKKDDQNDTPVDIDIGKETVLPGHWWKTEITEEQLQLLGDIWNTDVTYLDVLQKLWPEIEIELPQHMTIAWNEKAVQWSNPSWEEKYKNLKGPAPVPNILYCNVAVPNISGDPTGGYKAYALYMGIENYENETMEVFKFNELVPENTYRVSFYVDNIIGSN